MRGNAMDTKIELGENGTILVNAECVKANNMRVCHSHGVYELYYLREGNRILFADGCFYLIRPGDLFLVPPGMRHRTMDMDGGYEKIVIMLPCALVPRAVGAELRIVRPADARASSLCCIAEELDRLSRLSDLASQAQSLACVMQLLSAVLSLPPCAEAPIASPALGRVSDILNYIEESYTKRMTLSSLAERFFISEYYLCRIFKEYTGVTVNDYVTNLRLEKAACLLSAGISVREASRACGFGSEAAFAKAFRQKNGCCAKQFQMKLRSSDAEN